jgi:hypothetical protein
MRTAIQEIITEVPQGHIFDSHFVITCLVEKHSDRYLEFASGINAASKKTLSVHGKIGQEIAKFEGTVLERLEHNSWSKNIHRNDSPCACWRKR